MGHRGNEQKSTRRRLSAGCELGDLQKECWNGSDRVRREIPAMGATGDREEEAGENVSSAIFRERNRNRAAVENRCDCLRGQEI